MRLLLLGATEGLRYRMTEMLAGNQPAAVLEARHYPSAGAPFPVDNTYEAVICTVGRDGEHLPHIRRIASDYALRVPRVPVIALTDEHESYLHGRALIAGAELVIPLPGLSQALLLTSLNVAKSKAIAAAAQQRLKISLPAITGYRLVSCIGEGGMSKVYLAQRGESDLPVVVKIVDAHLAKDETFKLRFARECKLLSRIHHENVVRLHDYSVDTHRPYLAMEYFAGGDLKSRIRSGLPAITALKIMMQIAKAIDAVHSAGLVHRDLKPHNIMFRNREQLALVDFGLAKPVDPNNTSQMHLTQDGMVLATPVYMSPEQCLGKPQDARGDLYSCGVILYEMLAGSPPFMADNPAALAYQHVNAEIPKLPPRSAGFQNVIERLLAKNPDDRFQSARELFAHIAI